MWILSFLQVSGGWPALSLSQQTTPPENRLASGYNNILCSAIPPHHPVIQFFLALFTPAYKRKILADSFFFFPELLKGLQTYSQEVLLLQQPLLLQ